VAVIKSPVCGEIHAVTVQVLGRFCRIPTVKASCEGEGDGIETVVVGEIPRRKIGVHD
jgi:hypothetical protein